MSNKRIPKRGAAAGFAIAIAVVAAFAWAEKKWPSAGILRGLAQKAETIAAGKTPLNQIADAVELADGFAIKIFADKIPRARQLAIGDDGWIFVGTRGEKVFALRDSNGDGVADDKRIIADNLFAPNGVAFFQGALYIAEVDRVSRIADIARILEFGDAAEFELIISDLPTKTHHGFRYIKFSPNGELFISLGAPCNVCKPAEPELMGVIRRYDSDGGNGEVFAHGVRNSVGFDFHPQSGELWFTDNGRDWLGDDLPHDELNRAPQSGMHFGFPFCHQGNLPDPEFGDERHCDEFAPPILLAGPHVAALGMAFYRGDYFPPNYQNGIFIALHGSWNRSEKIGYAVHFAAIENGKVIKYAPFANWLNKAKKILGRPADVAVDNQGALLISDDFNGAIYRVVRAE